MNINKVFPSRFLKAADLKGRRVTVTIERVVMEEVGRDRDEKPICYFKELAKGLPLNKINTRTIAEIADSEETDEWPGTKITLFSTKVDFGGERVDAIRVERPAEPD